MKVNTGLLVLLCFVAVFVGSTNSLEVTMCDICFTVVEVARQRVWEYDSYSQIMEYENRLCQNVIAYKSECYDMVFKYLPMIVRYFKDDLKPRPTYRQICQNFNLCSSDY